MQILAENYTLKCDVPAQMKSLPDFFEKKEAVSTGNNGLLASIYIPLFFQIFFSFTMDTMWSIISYM
jgi:hypothetical protein